MVEPSNAQPVAVIGAGPAGIYAARELAQAGYAVALLNRDIKPGGLAEYGIYHDKYKMKEGLRKQFRQILANPAISYFGNVTVGKQGDITLEELKALGFGALLVTVGAQGTKWLAMPGEHLMGVYHAKDIVYHYNQLPPFSRKPYAIGRRVAVIGVGNVMMDIAHWLIRDRQVDEVIAVARRGPAEVKFTKAEMENVGANLDIAALDAELERVRPVMEAVGQDVAAARAFIVSGLTKAQPKISNSRLRFLFLASPSRILDNGQGGVGGLEVEDTTLLPTDSGDTKARSLGTYSVLGVDTVIFCIGDSVDESLGLPLKVLEFAKNPNPRFPVDGNSYETYDPATELPLEGLFVAGWARRASDGLVGVARKDGEQGARAVSQYLQTLPAGQPASKVMARLDALLEDLPHPVIRREEWQRLEEIERQLGEQKGVEFYKFSSNEEMLAALGLVEVSG